MKSPPTLFFLPCLPAPLVGLLHIWPLQATACFPSLYFGFHQPGAGSLSTSNCKGEKLDSAPPLRGSMMKQ